MNPVASEINFPGTVCLLGAPNTNKQTGIYQRTVTRCKQCHFLNLFGCAVWDVWLFSKGLWKFASHHNIKWLFFGKCKIKYQGVNNHIGGSNSSCISHSHLASHVAIWHLVYSSHLVSHISHLTSPAPDPLFLPAQSHWRLKVILRSGMHFPTK